MQRALNLDQIIIITRKRRENYKFFEIFFTIFISISHFFRLHLTQVYDFGHWLAAFCDYRYLVMYENQFIFAILVSFGECYACVCVCGWFMFILFKKTHQTHTHTQKHLKIAKNNIII